MSGKRLVVVTEYFWPDQAATGLLFGDLVDSLQRANPDMHLTVLTSDRLYRSSTPYSLPEFETRGKVNIHRCRSRRTGKDDSFLRRAWSDLVFSLGVARALRKIESDGILAVTNPPLVALIVSVLARLKRTAFFYVIYDLYPDLPVAQGLWANNSLLVRLIRNWQRYALNSATRVIAIGRCMREYLQKQYAVKPESIVVIPNWSTVPEGGAAPGESVLVNGMDPKALHVIYAGNLGLAQEFDTLLEAAQLVLGDPNVRFHLVGEGARRESLKATIEERGLTNVSLRGFMPQDQLNQVLSGRCLGVINLAPHLEGLAVPSKTYNLLAMGVPLLATMSEGTEVGQIIIETGCGVLVNHGQAGDLAAKIRAVANNPETFEEMRRRAKQYANEHATLSQAVASYSTLLAECLA